MTVVADITSRAQYRATRAVAARQRLRWAPYLIFLGMPAVLVWLYLRRGWTLQEALLENLAWLLFGPLFLFVGMPLLYRYSVYAMRKKNPACGGEQAYTFDTDGIRIRSGVADVQLKWAALHRIVETREFFLFYLGVNAAQFLPKAAVAEPARLEELRTLFREFLGDRAQVHEPTGTVRAPA